MNKKSISYLRTYINRYPTLDNLRYITKILNYLYYKFPDIRQIPDLRTQITIDEYLEVFNKNLDLYGITADFTDSNPYKALNDFKLKFKPTVYEYIGEFDLIVNKPFHQLLWSTNQIQKEFYKPAIKRTGAN